VTEQTPPATGVCGHRRGLLVAFEGGDGAGKSTQSSLLAGWLTERGAEVVQTREPGGTTLGQALRELVLHGQDGSVSPRAEALIFAADRAHHVATVVRPALDRGAVVLTDRYLDSSVAYQGAARRLGHDEVRELSLWAVENLVPDLTVLLDVSSEEGRARRGEVHDRLERETDDFHDRVRQGFLDLAAREPGRYLVLDAAVPPDDLAAAVRDRVASLLEDDGTPAGDGVPAAAGRHREPLARTRMSSEEPG
jgi:dTMP kinase